MLESELHNQSLKISFLPVLRIVCVINAPGFNIFWFLDFSKTTRLEVNVAVASWYESNIIEPNWVTSF